MESADPNSLLNWYKQLIALRRSNPALHDGSTTMIDKDNPDVFSYVRTGPKGSGSVVVAINMSAAAKTVTLDLGGSAVKTASAITLAASDPSLSNVTSLKAVTLPPFSSWIASVK
jgi:alpha-glucosidase